MMNPGKLNKKINILKSVSGFDDYGEPLDTTEQVHRCWASVKNKSGKEQFESVTPYSTTVTSFLIRHSKKIIDTSMTIEFEGNKYNIIYIDNYNFSNKWVEITAELVK